LINCKIVIEIEILDRLEIEKGYAGCVILKPTGILMLVPKSEKIWMMGIDRKEFPLPNY